MELAEGIRRIGFRRWYERRLVESHAYLVTGLLSAVLACGSLEGVSLRAPGPGLLFNLLVALCAGLLAAWAIHHYLAMLLHALTVGERSTCSQCATYGILELTATARSEAPGAGVAVRCRKCGHKWTIE